MRKVLSFLITIAMVLSLAISPGTAIDAFGETEAGDVLGVEASGGSLPAAGLDDEGADVNGMGDEAGSETEGEEGEESEASEEDEEGEDSVVEEFFVDDSLADIEDLTVDPDPGVDFDGYIVVVRPDEVSNDMIEAAPEDPVAGNLFPVETPEDALEFADPEQIKAIEPNYLMMPLVLADPFPYDPDFPLQWNLHGAGSYGINALGAWSRGLSGAGVRIAVIDSGIRAHNDMAPIKDGYRFGGNKLIATFAQGGYAAVDDDLASGHGTLVSSIIGASTDNGLNIAGPAYGAEIVPFKVLGSTLQATLLDLAAALNYIKQHNEANPEAKIDVINMSLGQYVNPGHSHLASLQGSINGLLEQGVIMVAAAGNNDTGVLTDKVYPAASEGVIGVASIGDKGVRASSSQTNDSVDIAAPGAAVYGLMSTNPSGITQKSGTSLAAPHVSAAAALVKEMDPDIDYEGFMDLLSRASKRPPEGGVSKSIEYGFGLLDAAALVKEYNRYTVRYSYEGVVDENLTETGYMKTDALSLAASLTLSDLKKPIRGYKVGSYTLDGVDASTELSYLLLEDQSVLEVDFVRDDSQIVNYQVKHEYGGKVDESMTDSLHVWAGDPTVFESDITQKNKAGFNFAGIDTELPAIVDEGQTFTVVYEADSTQVVNYKLIYLYDGVEDVALAETLSVWMGNPLVDAPSAALGARHGYIFDGYKLNGADMLPLLRTGDFPVVVEEGDVIALYYIRRDIRYEEGGWYIFDENGERTFGWVGDLYFSETRGRLHGLEQVPGLGDDTELRWCYFDPVTGSVVTGIVQIGSFTYYFDGVNGMVKDAEIIVDGRHYFFDANGRAIMGWRDENVGRRYYDSEGRAAGARKIGSQFYYFDRTTGLLNTKIGMIYDEQTGNYHYCHTASGFLRVNKFSARLNTAADVGQPWHSTVSRTYHANRTTAALTTGQIKEGSYWFWYEGYLGRLTNVERDVNGSGMYRFFGSNGRRANGWVDFTAARLLDEVAASRYVVGARVYYHSSRGLLTGANKIGSHWFWLDPNANGMLNRTIGLIHDEVNDVYHYCMAENGRLRFNGQQVMPDGKVYYFNKQARRASGPIKIGSYWFFYDRKDFQRLEFAVGQWIQDDDGSNYYVTATRGRLRTGWFTDPETGLRYNIDTKTARARVGAQKAGSSWYWFDPKSEPISGAMHNVIGAIVDDRNPLEIVHYYCRSEKGLLRVNGEQRVGDDVYYYGRDARRTSGPIRIGSRIFFYSRENGAKIVPDQSYWHVDDGTPYYITAPLGRLARGRFTDPETGVRLYMNLQTGAPLTGPVKIGSYWFYFDGMEGMVTNEQRIVGNPGGMVPMDDTLGQTQINGNRVYFYRANGRRASGWVTIPEDMPGGGGLKAGDRAYYTSAGITLGPKKIGSYRFFFDRQTGALARAPVNGVITWIFDGASKYCTQRTDGRLLTGSRKIDGENYWFASTGLMYMNGERKISSKWYFFDEQGRRLSNTWLDLPDGRRVYYGTNGARASGMAKAATIWEGETKDFWYFFSASTGNVVIGAEKKSGNHWYYFRAADEEAGIIFETWHNVVQPRVGFAALVGEPARGPAGSRVAGWWRHRGTTGLKFYSEAASTQGRRLHGRQVLPLHFWVNPVDYNVDAGGKLAFFLDPKTGNIRNGGGSGDSGLHNGNIWETDGNGVLTRWSKLGNVMRGIDVSYWQGSISAAQWRQVRSDNVEFVIARAGYTDKATGRFFLDSTFLNNVRRAKEAGIIVGAYIYVYSANVTLQNLAIDNFASEMARIGLSPRDFALPVFLDVEDPYYLAETNKLGGYAYRTSMTRSGMQRLERHGYTAGFYTFLSWANTQLDAKQLEREGYTFWLARFYNNDREMDPMTPSWNGDFPGIWQYRSTGRVNGISGNIDMNYLYPSRVKWS
ncbi:MAG: S8 family serine peptidase [Clostridiales bacterium]|nr:S8 family serine peptidase [Clostridiales bacterium]